MSETTTRASHAGEEMGKAIVEMVHLMYQNQTALAYIKALSVEINTERYEREQRPNKPKGAKNG